MVRIIFIVIVCFVLSWFSNGHALTPSSPVSVTSGNHEVQKTHIEKQTVFIKKIDQKILYLDNEKQYTLDGVKVTDVTKYGRVSNKKIVAEMIFIEGVLKEVILK